jgi:hypothetical protein
VPEAVPGRRWAAMFNAFGVGGRVRVERPEPNEGVRGRETGGQRALRGWENSGQPMRRERRVERSEGDPWNEDKRQTALTLALSQRERGR